MPELDLLRRTPRTACAESPFAVEPNIRPCAPRSFQDSVWRIGAKLVVVAHDAASSTAGCVHSHVFCSQIGTDSSLPCAFLDYPSPIRQISSRHMPCSDRWYNACHSSGDLALWRTHQLIFPHGIQCTSLRSALASVKDNHDRQRQHCARTLGISSSATADSLDCHVWPVAREADGSYRWKSQHGGSQFQRRCSPFAGTGVISLTSASSQQKRLSE